MYSAMETIDIRGAAVRLFIPLGYEVRPSQHFPLLLSLGDLDAAAGVDALHAEGVLPEFVVAGISPNPSIGAIPDLAGIVAKIASSYRLLETPSACWIEGTGLNAITALEALLDHPEVFGAAACLSTSFEGIEGAPPLHSLALRRLEERISLPGGIRFYFDYGTLGIDECYEPYHRDLGAILRCKGWREEREFRITKITRGSHTPASWQERLDPALRWLASPHH